MQTFPETTELNTSKETHIEGQVSKNQASAAQNFLAEAQPSPETLSYEWFSAWFSSPIYLKLYEHRNFKEAEETVEMILRRTGLKETQPKPKVLDIACGAGRHAVAFAERGCDVVASDLSSFMLQEAKRVAEKHSVRLTFLQQDMRALTAEEEYDLVVQLFTSFGYFDNSEDDRRVVQNVRRALRQGGIYVLDFFNAEKVRQSYKPLTQRVVDGMLICEERKIVGDRIKKTVTVSENGNLKRFTESVRLYTATELAEMLTQAGFKVREILGNYDGSPFDAAQSPRAILFAEKVK